MITTLLRASVLVLLGVPAVPWNAASVPSTPAQRESDLTALRAREMHHKLASPVTLEKGLDNVPFNDAREFLQDRYDVTIVIDSNAFETDYGLDKVPEFKVSLPKMVGVRLSTVLRMLAVQFNGTYLVRSDHILITTPLHTRPEYWKAGYPQLVPGVDAEFDKRPLSEALRKLAQLTGINIVLDARVGEKGKAAVTATLTNAPLDTAVRLLADMAGLRSVAVDGALYVTTKKNAEQWKTEKPKAVEATPTQPVKPEKPAAPAAGAATKTAPAEAKKP